MPPPVHGPAATALAGVGALTTATPPRPVKGCCAGRWAPAPAGRAGLNWGTWDVPTGAAAAGAAAAPAAPPFPLALPCAGTAWGWGCTAGPGLPCRALPRRGALCCRGMARELPCCACCGPCCACCSEALARMAAEGGRATPALLWAASCCPEAVASEGACGRCACPARCVALPAVPLGPLPCRWATTALAAPGWAAAAEG